MTKPTRHMKHGEMKALIIQMAMKMFTEQGFSATTSSEICKKLDISKGTLTRHFATKEHLLCEIVQLLAENHSEYVDGLLDSGTSPLSVFCMECASQIAFCEKYPHIKDLYIAAYTSGMCVPIIIEWSSGNSQRLLSGLLPLWSPRNFGEVQVAVHGIELGALVTPCTEEYTLVNKVARTLDCILKLYNTSEQTRNNLIREMISLDLNRIGDQAHDIMMGKLSRSKP